MKYRVNVIFTSTAGFIEADFHESSEEFITIDDDSDDVEWDISEKVDAICEDWANYIADELVQNRCFEIINVERIK